MRRLRLLIGGQDVTDYVSDAITFSNVDPGGFEAASFAFGRRVAVSRGAKVTIQSGVGVAWEGRVAEVGKRQGSTQVSCEGYGARLKDNTMAELWVHQLFSEWSTISTQRHLNLLAAGYGHTPHVVETDPVGGTPALVTAQSGAWTAAAKADSEAKFDAGDTARVKEVRYGWSRGSTIVVSDTNWTYLVRGADNPEWTTNNQPSANLLALGPATGTLTFTNPKRFVGVVLAYGTGPSGGTNTSYPIYWTKLRLYGSHGLTPRGTEEGLWPSDIIRNVIGRVSGIVPGVITDSSNFAIPHLAHLAAVPFEQVIADAASYMPWHWGTWENQSILASTPRFDFRPYPAAPTATIYRSSCSNFDTPERLADLYNQVDVTWADVAGTKRITRRTRAVAELAAIPLTRTLAIDMGTATDASAQTFGDYALELAERTARSTGSATIEEGVSSKVGRKPAYLLRAGLDKVAIPDLADIPALDLSRRQFNVRRVETVAGADGIKTTVEFGAGSSAIEVLQARLAAVTELALQ